MSSPPQPSEGISHSTQPYAKRPMVQVYFRILVVNNTYHILESSWPPDPSSGDLIFPLVYLKVNDSVCLFILFVNFFLMIIYLLLLLS